MDEQDQTGLPSISKFLEDEEITNDSDAAEFDKFLDKVNEIKSIIEAMRSTDPTISTKALSKADEIIAAQKNVNKNEDEKTRIKYSRTVLNKNALKETSPNIHLQATMSAAEFMAAVEQDAEERASKKIKEGSKR